MDQSRMPVGLDIIVFSHLRWDFVFQRPQHLLSRFATDHRIWFFEEPIHTKENSYLEVKTVAPNICVVKPYTQVSAGGYDPSQMPTLKHLLSGLVEKNGLTNCIAWFYTPLALPLLDVLDQELVIYDSMDALDAFKNASPLLREAEVNLLKVADVVFTGGRSLYKRLVGRHHNVHCFPSSVDVRHFATATQPGVDPKDQASIPKPRLGYFGVIDERIDLELIRSVAAANPQWQLVMLGPVVKIDEASLPRLPNVHYLGGKDYADLPSYLAGWDVCLLPFARNESTQFISPTKTLEYMVASKPIVSTRITDVADNYSHVVEIADTYDEFAEACARSLTISFEDHKARSMATRKILENTSWDKTVAGMTEEIDALLPGEGTSKDCGDVESTQVLVLGAGPTGLSATYHLDYEALLLEKNSEVGGWCRSVVKNGFTFDYAGHIMFSNDPYVHELYNKLLGSNLHWQDREAWIYSKSVYTRYPFQGALYGLPASVIKECIVGAIESRYGSMSEAGEKSAATPELSKPTFDKTECGTESSKSPAAANGHASVLEDCCGDGVLESTVKLCEETQTSNKLQSKPQGENFEQFIYRVWGTGIAKHFAVPYNKKLWAVPLTEMETSWLGGRVPMPNLNEMIEGALEPVAKPMGPNARFGYPLKGGFQSLMNGFLPWVQDRLELDAVVVAISPKNHTVALKDGRTYHYEQLVSTMPLPVLIRMLGDEAPNAIVSAANALRHVSVRCVNIGIDRDAVTDKHWIYYPEQTVFHRIFVQGNASPHCNPEGGFGLTCEITYSPYKPLPCDGQALIERCIADCREVGLILPDDEILVSFQVDMPHAYVVYDHDRKASVKLIREWLLENEILLAGRYSEWEYYNSDHAFLAGKRVADEVRELRAKKLNATTSSSGKSKSVRV